MHPLFEREALNATMVKLTAQNKLFSNCSGPVMATLARHAVYHDPFKVHPLDQRYRYDGIIEEYVLSPDWTRQWRNAEPLAEWVPEYIDLAKAPDPAWVLSATSAIPFAWKALTLPRPDVFGPERNDVFVDGGLVDNFPLLPAAAAKPEFIIAVALNAFDTLGDDLSLRRTIQENWRRSFFSKRENDDVADNMRDKWIKSLPPGYFAEREARAKALAQYAPSFFSKFVSMSPGPFPSLPPVGPDLEDTKVIFLRPSKATSINLPILGLITGTIRFDRSYKKKLVAMGIKDAEMLFAPTLAETSSRD